MSYSNENVTKRRSQRLYKGLDLASPQKVESQPSESPNLSESILDRLRKRPSSITSKIETSLNVRRSKKLKILQQQQQQQQKQEQIETISPTNTNDDDCIVLSSDEEVKASRQRKLSTSTETSSASNVILNEPRNSLPSEEIILNEAIQVLVTPIDSVKSNGQEENKLVEDVVVEEPKAEIETETIKDAVLLKEKESENAEIVKEKENSEIVKEKERENAEKVKENEKENSEIVKEKERENAEIVKEKENAEIVKEKEDAPKEEETTNQTSEMLNIEKDKPDIIKLNGIRKLSCVMVPKLETDLANAKLASLGTNNNNKVSDTPQHETNDEDDDDDEPILPKTSNKNRIIRSDSETESDENIVINDDDYEVEDSESDDDDDNEYHVGVTLKNKWCVCENDSSNNNDKKMCDSKCGQWYHLSCLGYSKEEIQRMNNRKLEQNERFVCPVCRNDQEFIEKYKKAIEFRHKTYSSYLKSSSSSSASSSSSSESESEHSTQESDTKPKKSKLPSELSEKEKKEKLDRLKLKQKQPSQTKLINFNKTNLKSNSKPKSSGLTYKSLIDKTTSNKEKNKIFTTSQHLKNSNISPSSTSSRLTDSKQCLYCKKHLSNAKTVPNKLIQDMLFENADELKANWSHSVYCDEKCILNYAESELAKRQSELSMPKHKESSNFDIKRKYIYLLDHSNKSRTLHIVTLNKTQEDLKKECYSKITKQPKWFIVDLDHLDHLIASNTIQKPNSSSSTSKPTETKKIPTSMPSRSSASTLNIQRSMSNPVKITPATTKPMPTHPIHPNDYRSKFKEQLLRIFKQKIELNSSLAEKKAVLDELVNEIESNFNAHFQKDEQMYIKRSRKVVLNLNMQSNNLYLHILNGQIKPNELATLSDDMLNELRTKERQEAEKADIANIIKYNDEINESKLQRVKKTHKGEELIDYQFDKDEQKSEEADKNLNKSDSPSATNENKPESESPSLDQANLVNSSPTSISSLSNNKIVSPSFARSISVPASKSLINPTSSLFLTKSNNTNKQINSDRTKERRVDSDFESDEEDNHTTASKAKLNSIDKPTVPLTFLKPTLSVDTAPIKSVDLRPSALLSPPKPIPPTPNNLPPKPPTHALTIDTISFDIGSSGPNSPPLHTANLASNFVWSSRIFLKMLNLNVWSVTCLRANMLRSLKPDAQVDTLSKSLVQKLKSMPQIQFEFDVKHRLVRERFHFWSYLVKLKREFQVPLLFFHFDSYGTEPNTIHFNKDNPLDRIKVKDNEGFFHLRNNLDKNYVYEYKANDELKSLIGYFYVVVLKAKPNGSQWFKENLSVDVDRNNKDVVLGVLIDSDSKLKHELPPDFSFEVFPPKTTTSATTTTNSTSSATNNRVVILPRSVSVDDKQKRKLSDSAEVEESKRKKLDENKPTQPEESEQVHKIGADRDPRIKRIARPAEQPIVETTTSTTASNTSKPAKDQEKITEPEQQTTKSSAETNLETTKNDATTATSKFDVFKHIDTVLSNLDKDDLAMREAELFNFFSLPERKLLTTNEKILLNEKYQAIFPDFLILINLNESETSTTSTNSSSSSVTKQLPPPEMWQGTDKEAVKNCLKIHVDYKKNKNIRDFTFENENWNLNDTSFSKKPDLVFEVDSDENDVIRIESAGDTAAAFRRSPDSSSSQRKVTLINSTGGSSSSSHSNYSERYSNYDNYHNSKASSFKTNSFSNNSNRYFSSSNSGGSSRYYAPKRNRSRSRNREDSNKISRTDKI